MLYFLLPYGNICSLIRLFYKISYIFMICKIVRKIVVTRIRPLWAYSCNYNLRIATRLITDFSSLQSMVLPLVSLAPQCVGGSPGGRQEAKSEAADRRGRGGGGIHAHLQCNYFQSCNYCMHRNCNIM